MGVPLPTDGFVEVNGATLFYQVTGAGRPVVLLHAGIADSRMWNDQMTAFAPEFTVVHYDLWGFGRSSFPPAPFAHHDDLFGLLRPPGRRDPTQIKAQARWSRSARCS